MGTRLYRRPGGKIDTGRLSLDAGVGAAAALDGCPAGGGPGPAEIGTAAWP